MSRAYSIVNEDQVGPVRFTVELSHPDTTASERNPAVGWRTVPGTAALGADYQGANGKLTFMPGVNTGFIDVDVVDDNLFESALETFSVELVANDTRFATISPTEGSFEVSIRDNETLTASVAADAETVAEGNDTTFTVTLTGGVPADASVFPSRLPAPPPSRTTMLRPKERSRSRPETPAARPESWRFPPASRKGPSPSRCWRTASAKTRKP